MAVTGRLQNWPERLGDVITQARADTFEWGRNDCVLFAARCVEAVTGEHPCPELIGAYSTEAGALAALSGAGFSSLAEAFAARVGAERPVPFAQRGDLVVFGGFVGGVVGLGGDFAVCLDPVSGIALRPTLTASAAFTVG